MNLLLLVKEFTAIMGKKKHLKKTLFKEL